MDTPKNTVSPQDPHPEAENGTPSALHLGKAVLLDKEMVGAIHVIPRSHWIQSHNPRVFVEERVDELIVKVEAEVLAADPVTIYWEVRYPASWWDHFKKDVLLPLTRNPSTQLGKRLYQWAWDWKWERASHKETVNRRVCPHLDVPPTPQGRSHVEWLTSRYS
jgi:hypothetical protein